MSRPICTDPTTTLHFVDDRLDTLLAARAAPDLTARPWKLYLASWGYCTAEEVAEARRQEGIQVRAPHLGGRGEADPMHRRVNLSPHIRFPH